MALSNPIAYLDLVLVFTIWLATFFIIHENYRKAFTWLSACLFSIKIGLDQVNLPLLEGVFSQMLWVASLLLIIVFQPELRRMFERLRHIRNWLPFLFSHTPKTPTAKKALISAIKTLSEKKIGALIVIKNNSDLTEYTETGIKLDAFISPELILSIFQPQSPLHDGACIIEQNRLSYASCLLPLTEMQVPDNRLGTRHRAGLGLSDISDATILIVSQESGQISLAESGNLTTHLSSNSLEELLFSF